MTYVTILLALTAAAMVVYGAALTRREGRADAGLAPFGIAAVAVLFIVAYRLTE